MKYIITWVVLEWFTVPCPDKPKVHVINGFRVYETCSALHSMAEVKRQKKIFDAKDSTVAYAYFDSLQFISHHGFYKSIDSVAMEINKK